jgi:hypothetical protein
MLANISPKVYVPVAISVLAALALWLITGDSTYLVTILIGLIGGGVGAAAPPAPGVRQRDIADLAQPGLSAAQVKAVHARIAKRRRLV